MSFDEHNFLTARAVFFRIDKGDSRVHRRQGARELPDNNSHFHKSPIVYEKGFVKNNSNFDENEYEEKTYLTIIKHVRMFKI